MYIFWTIAGIIFLILEFIKSSVYKLTLSCAFLFSAIVAYKFPLNFKYQLGGFVVFSATFYILIKAVLKKEQKDKNKLNHLVAIEGKTALVKKDIGKTLSIDGLGAVEFNNELYSAKSIDDREIKAGRVVEIVSRENMILNVKVKEDANQ